MLVGLRKKHWVVASLSVTAFLLVLVLSTRPLTPATHFAGGAEIAFLRRRIANDESGGATGSGTDTGTGEAAPATLRPDTQPGPQLKTNTKEPGHSLEESQSEPRSDPVKQLPAPPSTHKPVHLTDSQRKALAKDGILLIEDQPPLTNDVTQQQAKQQPSEENSELQTQQQPSPPQQAENETVPPQQTQQKKVLPQKSPDTKQSSQQKQQTSQLKQQESLKKSQTQQRQSQERRQQHHQDAHLSLGSSGNQHDKWLKQVQAQHQTFLRAQHKMHDDHLFETEMLKKKLQEMQQEQGVVPAPGPMQSSSSPTKEKQKQWINRLNSGPIYENLKQSGVNTARQMLQRSFSGIENTINFTPGNEVDPAQVRRVLVLSTWRSGSTYLGALLKAYPGTYYSFEPLHFLLQNQHLQEGPEVEVAQNTLRGILTCDYSNMDAYINHARNLTYLISHNTRLWNSCFRNRALCYDKDFLSRVCKLMPVNVLKTVRMGLSPVVDLLQDHALQLRVIHLVRDPRGCLHSRLKLSWCVAPACRDPTTVCQDLLTDLTLSDWVKENFPDRYLLVRYEDLGLHPAEKAREIYKFLDLSYNKYVSSFVKEHTTPSKKKKKNNAYGTIRDSKATIFAWRDDLNFTEVDQIQRACLEPLQRLSLRVFENKEEYLNTSIPVLLDV